MSRGPGAIQAAILTRVREEPGIFVGRLRWEVAQELGKLGSDGGLTPSFYRSVQRAWKELATGPEASLQEEKRRLNTLAEVTVHYPFKTQSVEIRRVREQVLPLIEEQLEKHGGQYSAIDSEKFVLRQSREARTSEDWREARRRWRRIERRRLLPLLAEGDLETDAKHLVLATIVKCAEYFAPQRGFAHRSRTLAGILQDFRALASEDPRFSKASADLSKLFIRWLPPSKRRVANLKSELRQFVGFDQRGAAHMDPRWKEKLFEERPEVLRAIPGNTYPEPGPDPPERWMRRGSRAHLNQQHSPLLDKAVMHDVLQKFSFLSIAS